MTVLVTLRGTALILVGLYDIFRTLFQPDGRGVISERVAYGIWKIFRRTAGQRHSILMLAGPAAFVASCLTWCLLLLFGWTLLYYPAMPQDFSYSPGVYPEVQGGLLDALYLSFVTLGTLGYGDITPVGTTMRILSPLQALFGFLLLTTIITWLLSIYPGLARREAFAREVTTLRNAEASQSIDLIELHGDTTGQMLGTLTSQLITIRGDLQQFPITYYFHNSEPDSALAIVMPYVMDLAERGSRDECPAEIRFQAARLQGAVEALSQTLVPRFLDMPRHSPERIFTAYAQDHFHHD